MSSKNNAFNLIKQFIAMVDNQFHGTVQLLGLTMH